MVELAPSLCPVCDRKYEDQHFDDETNTLIYLHYKFKVKCVRSQEEDRTEPMVVPNVGDQKRTNDPFDW